MKEFVSIDKEIGGDGAHVKGSLGVEVDQLVAEVKVTYPLAKVIEPAMKVVDGLVDKIEVLIPGDQKALAAALKADAREQLLKLVSEDVA